MSKRKSHWVCATPTYKSWESMRSRVCKTSKKAKWYANRGIGVCKRWNKFANFLEDMGERPKGTSLDRIDNNKGYEPGNCRWATRHQQMQNKRTNVNITYNGKTQCVTAWARELRMVRATLAKRLANGWPIEKVLTAKRFYEQSGWWGHKRELNSKQRSRLKEAKTAEITGA